MGFAPPKQPQKESVAVDRRRAGRAWPARFYLTRLGYKPVVFEALQVAGGMMKVGIPDYRLPKDKLAGRDPVIERAGVEIHLEFPGGVGRRT